MNKKIKHLFELNTRSFFIILIIFTAATFILDGRYVKELVIAQGCIIVALFIYSRIQNRRRSREIVRELESVIYNLDTAASSSLANFPMPMVVFGLDDKKIIRANEAFGKLTGVGNRFFEKDITDLVPDFNTKWLLDGKSECPELVELDEKLFRIYGSIVRTGEKNDDPAWIATTYWMDVTYYSSLEAEYMDSRPVFALIVIDNYEELLKNTSEKEKSLTMSQIDDRVSDWTSICDGYLCKFDRDRYIFIFEERVMQHFIDDKFSLMDSVRQVSVRGVPATVSIGIGKDARTFDEAFQFASLAIDMALSRGGDQTVIKNKYNFDFFGGRSSELEKRTKVKSRVMANSLSELMGESSKIYIMGHKYADLDAVGAAAGMCCAARKCGKRAKIVIDMNTQVAKSLTDRLMTAPEYMGAFISPQDALLEADGQSLLIVVDTNRPEQVESKSLLESCNRVAIIDHHRRAASFIQNTALSFHEPYASSACELVAELLQYMLETEDILKVEAEALMAGIILDTKSFAMRTGSRTFEAAAFLRRAGADTADVKRMLQSDMETARARYGIIQKAKIYKAGIAIAASETMQSRIIAAQAADELLNISGVRASFVVFPETASTVSISARSLDEINVQFIVEKLGGGGNRNTAGAQVEGKTLVEVVEALLKSIDMYLEDNETLLE